MAKLKKEAILKAIEGSSGNITLIAQRLNCTRMGFYKHLKRHPELNELLSDEENRFLDIATTKLQQAVINGEAWAIKYFMSTKGKPRGYGPENSTSVNVMQMQQVEGISNEELKVIYEVLSKRQNVESET